MNTYEEDKFTILNENNEEKTYYKMITFESMLTNKKYLIYTDNKYTDGQINIYSSILLSDENNNIKLEQITKEIDRAEVNKALLQIKINS